MELNKHLQPVGSLPDTKGTISTGVSFGMMNKRNAVTGTRIRNFNFSQGFGGTLTLGGTANGNGQFVLENAAGGTIVTGDQNGLTITNGSISIKNSSSQTAFDSMGLVSNSNNFSLVGAAINSLNQSITGTAETNITGGSLKFVLSRTSNVLFTYKSSNFLTQGSVDTANLTVRLKLNGTEYDRLVNTGVSYTDQSMHTYSSAFPQQLLSGTYVASLTAQQEAVIGTPSSTIYGFEVDYTILGT